MTFEEFIFYKEQAAAKDAAKEADEKATKRTRKQDSYDLLMEHGEIPLDLQKTLEEINDIELLVKYLKAAAKVDSIQAFMDIVCSDAAGQDAT